MAFLKKKDVNLYYETIGDAGPWVSFVNGYTRPGSDFKVFAKKIASAGFRALILDNRGSGRTEAFSSFSLEDMAGDVSDLWNELEIKKSHVLGISMGGIIAQILGQTNQIDSLILVSSTMNREFLQADRSWPSTTEAIEEKLLGYFHPEFYKRNNVLIQMMAKTIFKQSQEGSFIHNAAAQSHAIASYQWDAKCPSELPILILHGDDDQIIPFSAAQQLKAAYSQAHLHAFKKCGHMLLAENINGLVSEFLNFMNLLNLDSEISASQQ